jgi:hypothetical protein
LHYFIVIIAFSIIMLLTGLYVKVGIFVHMWKALS